MSGKSHALNLPNYQPGRHTPPNREYYSEVSNEQVVFIINRNTGLAPYSHEFVPNKTDPQILSGFICAMASFMGEVTGTPSTNWKTVYSPESTLLVEGGNWSVGVIAVSRETSEVRSKLRRVVREFEETFQQIKDTNQITGNIYKEFDNFVRRVFIDDRLSEHSILLKDEDWFEYCKGFTLPSTRFRVTNYLYYAQNGQSLGEIAREQGYAIDEIKDLTSQAIWNRVVLVEYTPSPQEILSISEGALSTLYDITGPVNLSKEVLRAIGELDGRRKLVEILNAQNITDRSSVCAEIGILLNKGYLQRISTERKLVLLQECVLSKLLQAFSEYTNNVYLKAQLKDAIIAGTNRYPWLSKICISDDLEVRCSFVDGMTPTDLDYVYNALVYLVDTVSDQMRARFSPTDIGLMMEGIEKDCNERWLPSLWEEML